MGAGKFLDTARLNGLTVTPGEAQDTVDLYRGMFTEVPAFWNRARDAIPHLLRGTTFVVDSLGLVTTDNHRLVKPSGMPLLYQNLHKEPKRDENNVVTGWEWVYDGYDEESGRPMARRVYGGKLVENIVQSVARDIVCEQMLAIEKMLAERQVADTTGKKTYHVAWQVHDEVVAVVPKEEAAEIAKEMERIMSISPSWFPQVPLAAEADWSYRYGDCK